MELLLYPLLAGVLIALVGGPLGSFIVWQRMAYVGEGIAHSALLGVALGVWLDYPVMLMVMAVCCGLAILLNRLQKFLGLSINTILAIMAHTSLATGLVIISLLPQLRLDINSLLFGDLLMTSKDTLLLMAGVVSAIFIFLLRYWQALVALCANEELAAVEGYPTQHLQLALNLALAFLVAVGIKAVGVLLIVSLLIIPAATSRKWVDSPEQMAVAASLIGILAVIGGLAFSYQVNTPAGPTIVALAGFGYFFSQVLLFAIDSWRQFPETKSR